MATHVRHFFVMWLGAGDACAAVSSWTSSRLGRGVVDQQTPTHKYLPRLDYCTYRNSFACARSWQQTELRPERYVHMNMDFLNRYLSACPIPSA